MLLVTKGAQRIHSQCSPGRQQRSYGDRYAPPQLLIDMVAAGELGKKTGRGFYEYHTQDRAGIKNGVTQPAPARAER